VARLAQKHGKPKAPTILAHKLARAVYFMPSRGHAFDATKFFPASAARGHAMRTPAGPRTRPSTPLRRSGAPPAAMTQRAGATRPDREGGRYLRTPEIDPSTEEISLMGRGQGGIDAEHGRRLNALEGHGRARRLTEP
jgi:hypothetical protein